MRENERLIEELLLEWQDAQTPLKKHLNFDFRLEGYYFVISLDIFLIYITGFNKTGLI